jgi:hypothetical protein
MANSLPREAATAERWRDALAIAICLVSTALGAGAIVAGWRPATVVGYMGTAWAVTGNWLSRRGWQHFRMTPGQIYRQARQDGSRRPRLAKTILSGAVLLFIAAAVCFFR